MFRTSKVPTPQVRFHEGEIQENQAGKKTYAERARPEKFFPASSTHITPLAYFSSRGRGRVKPVKLGEEEEEEEKGQKELTCQQ